MSNTSERAVIITAIVAIIVAVITQGVAVYNQWLIHRLTQRRETEKYYNEVYQKLFAPVIPDVFLYIDMVTNFRRGHDTTPEQEIEVKDRAIATIRENLPYGSPMLTSMYHRIESSKYSDWSGHNPSRSELLFLHEFVREYEHAIQRSSIFLGRDKREQLAPVHQRMILYLLFVNSHTVMASLSWMFDPQAYTAENYRKIAAFFRRLSDDYDKRRRQEEAERKKFEQSLNEKDHNRRIEQLNAHGMTLRAKYDELSRKSGTKTIEEIVNMLVRNPEDRQVIVGSAVSEKYPSQLDTT